MVEFIETTGMFLSITLMQQILYADFYQEYSQCVLHVHNYTLYSTMISSHEYGYMPL